MRAIIRKVRNRSAIPSDPRSIVPTMTGATRGDRGPRQRERRSGLFSRAKIVPHNEDQEAEVWAQLYARPAGPERTVRRVQRHESPMRVEWVERADVPIEAQRAEHRPAA
jgi:hypothetical protein